MTKYVHNECNITERAFQAKNIQTGQRSTTKLKSTCKNSGTFEGKKNSPEKVT